MADLSDLSEFSASRKFPTEIACEVGIFRLSSSAMETELRSNLMACASAYAEARKVSLATLGRLAAGDWRFFDRLDDDAKTFTARKYDEVIAWFSERWPEEIPWPSEVARPVSEVRA